LRDFGMFFVYILGTCCRHDHKSSDLEMDIG
jgi:hypothetical protein